jgi:hypothetical protein
MKYEKYHNAVIMEQQHMFMKWIQQDWIEFHCY